MTDAGEGARATREMHISFGAKEASQDEQG
jgi:hypothetical protein